MGAKIKSTLNELIVYKWLVLMNTLNLFVKMKLIAQQIKSYHLYNV